ncbi:MAG: hypothetical protein K9G47_13765 [Bacteroidales bacterium]|nr:hypothetical protein [Bacteroidales bacterium]
MIILIMSSCKKDLTRIIKPEWNPNLAIPFIESSITLDDLIEPDSNLVINPDGSLKVIYSNDSVFSINIDEVFSFPEQPTGQQEFSMGAIKFADFSFTWPVSLADLIAYLPPPVQDTLSKYENKQTIFPPFTLQEPIFNEAGEIPFFKTLSFSEGTLIIEIAHDLPIVIQEIEMNIYNGNEQLLLGNLNFLEVPPGEAFLDSILLDGKTIENTFYTEIVEFSSPGSFPDSVLINLEDVLSIGIASNNLRVVSGEGYITEQIVINEEKMLDFSLDEDIQLKELSIKEGRIRYIIESAMPVELNLKLNLPTASQGGGIPGQSLNIPPAVPLEIVWDLAGTDFDLSTNPEKPYNNFPVNYVITLAASEQILAFDSSSKVILDFQPEDFEASLAKGFLGTKEVDIEADTLDLQLDFLENFSSGLTLTDPEIKIDYTNSIGLEFNMSLNLTGINNEGDTRNMDLPNFAVMSPQEIGESVQGQFLVNKNNSVIVDFLSISPEQLIYQGTGIANPEAVPENFVTDESFFNAGIDVDLPIKLQAENLIFTDTVEVNFSEEDIGSIERGKIYFAVDNGFPFGILLEFLIMDPTGQFVVDRISLEKIESAAVNAAGKVVKSKQSILEAEISNATYQNLLNSKHTVLKARLNTPGSGQMPVALYTDYSIGVRMGLEIKGRI